MAETTYLYKHCGGLWGETVKDGDGKNHVDCPNCGDKVEPYRSTNLRFADPMAANHINIPASAQAFPDVDSLLDYASEACEKVREFENAVQLGCIGVLTDPQGSGRAFLLFVKKGKIIAILDNTGHVFQFKEEISIRKLVEDIEKNNNTITEAATLFKGKFH